MSRWVSADHHFNHTNIIKYCDRPFRNAEEMDAVMIKRWNETVEPDDTVYYIGDFCMRGHANPDGVLRRLNGDVILIRGNHDKLHPEPPKGFKAIYPYYILNHKGCLISMCHYPGADISSAFPNKYIIYLCGHVHEKWKFSGRDMNIGVDQWDFRPISIDKAIEECPVKAISWSN